MKNISKIEILLTVIFHLLIIIGGTILVSWLTLLLFNHRLRSSVASVAIWFFFLALGVTYQVRPQNPLSMNILGKNSRFFWGVSLIHWLLIISTQ